MKPDTSPKSIWYISKYFAAPSPSSSEGGRAYQLMRELSAAGHAVLVLTSDSAHLVDVPEVVGSHWVQRIDGMQICWIRTMKFVGARSVRRALSWLHFEWRLLRLPRRQFERPDVIVASSLSLFSVLTGIFLQRRYRARLIFEVRDIWPLTIVEEGGFSRRNPLVAMMGWVERTGYRRADAIVGTMPNLGAHVEKVLGHSRPTYCVPMGVSETALEAPTPLPTGYVDTYIPSEQFVVGYAGTIGATNALDTLFETAALLKGQPIHFLIAGDGDLRERYIEMYGHWSNVTFAEKVAKQSVQALLAHCDVLYFAVHRSEVWEYGQSLNKLIDYMLAGKPVVASYSGYPSMLNEAGSGTFIPAGDAPALANELRRLSALVPAELKATGDRGRNWLINQRNYSQLASEYAAIMFPSR